MDSYRSKSCRDGREMQVENDSGRDLAPSAGMNDLNITRSYSTSHACYASSSSSVHPPPPLAQVKKSNQQQGGSIGKSWSFSDPELKRKTRVAGYKIYTVQGKMKGSFRKSFRWIKDNIVYGWRELHNSKLLCKQQAVMRKQPAVLESDRKQDTSPTNKE